MEGMKTMARASSTNCAMRRAEKRIQPRATAMNTAGTTA
jgi:hypothetical protein